MATVEELRKEVRFEYTVGTGFVHRRGPNEIVSMMLSSTHLLADGMTHRIPMNLGYQEMRLMPVLGERMTMNDYPIKHWVFPNFATLEIDKKYLDDTVFEIGNDKVRMGSNDRLKVGYVANKSDGFPYMLFSLFSDRWYSFAHYKRQIIYLGAGYRVGHVEVVGDVCASNAYQGDIVVDGQWRKVGRKPLFNLPNLSGGHKEGAILEIDGLEYRVKVRKTHDLIVTHIGEGYVQVQTNGREKSIRYPAPKFQVSLGQIVECANGELLRIRADKSKAETTEAYDRIENSLLLFELEQRLVLMTSYSIATQRERRYPEWHLIDDQDLNEFLGKCGNVLSVINEFSQYAARDVVYTMRAMGCIMTSALYVNPQECTYRAFKQYYEGCTMLPKIKRPMPTLFDFERQMLEEITNQEESILRDCAGTIQDQDEFVQQLEGDVMGSCIDLVRNMDPTKIGHHTKICANQILKSSVNMCRACQYNMAVKLLVERVSRIGETGLDVNELDQQIGLYRRYPVIARVPRIEEHQGSTTRQYCEIRSRVSRRDEEPGARKLRRDQRKKSKLKVFKFGEGSE